MDELKEHYNLLKDILEIRKQLANNSDIKEELNEITGIGKNYKTVDSSLKNNAKPSKSKEESKPIISTDDIINTDDFKKRVELLKRELK